MLKLLELLVLLLFFFFCQRIKKLLNPEHLLMITSEIIQLYCIHYYEQPERSIGIIMIQFDTYEVNNY